MNNENVEVAKAIAESFNREQLYPSMTVGGLKKALALIGTEYDDNVVAFSFLLKDMGDSGNNDGMKNFVLGTIPIKCLSRHPDDMRILVCDDASTEYFINYCKSRKTSVKQ